MKRNDNKNKREVMLAMAKLAISSPTIEAFRQLKQKVEERLAVS